jgi:thioredoxin reductase (NADPH)
MSFTLEMASMEASQKEQEHVRVLILGAGPAGLAAAVYAARADLAPVVLTGINFGGQAALTNTIENYPGFPDGVGGTQLGDLIKTQAERFGASIVYDSAMSVDLRNRPFSIKTYSKEYLADALIIATGASPNLLNISGEKELTGKGVSYCATCDGWFFKNKDIVVIGGGDSALEEGIFLTRFGSSVTIVHRRDALRAGVLLQKRAQENPKIKFVLNTVPLGVEGTDKVNGLKVKNVVTQEETVQKADGVFIFIGSTPQTELFKGQLEMDAHGYLVLKNQMETSVPGVFAAGEVADSIYRQVVTSTGMGAAAAIQATKFLEQEEK